MEKVDYVLIGNISFDYNYYPGRDGEVLKEVMNYGGATIYSGIPASLFTKVGIVAKVGEDYDLSVLSPFNFDMRGIKVVEGQTTVFTQEFLSDDGQIREFKEYVNPNTVVRPEDIPKEYLSAKYIHVCTNYPEAQLAIVKYLKQHSNAILSIDTLEDYYYDSQLFKYIKESFDLVDIAYVDKEFEKLFDCKAPIKILKLGKSGCRYISKDKSFQVMAPKCDFVVDKTGAGDCVTGIFGALKVRGYSDEVALQGAVNIATESIKGYGFFHLYDKKEEVKSLVKIKDS